MQIVRSSNYRHNALFKAVSLSIAVMFLFNASVGLTFADTPGKGLSIADYGAVETHHEPTIKNLANAALPLSMGYIRKVHIQDTGKPFVIYVQDAHCNYSCQKSIESIIGYFNKEYGVNLAAVEGGAGNYNFSIFTSIPDMDIREKVADYFVREGRVTGVELFAIMNPDKLTVKGLEESKLYAKNLSVYRESLSFKDRIERYMNILRHFIQNLKPPIFSKNIKDFDAQKMAYEENKRKLKDYIVYLDDISTDQAIDIDQFTNLTHLLRLIDEENNIDFKRANREREFVFDTLIKKLSRLEISELTEKTIAFKEGNITRSDFYDYLFRVMQTCGINVREYPNLHKYKAYLDKYDALEKHVFFEEMFDVERHIADNLFTTDDEERLFRLSDDLSLMDRLFAVSLTRQQYDYLMTKKDQLSTKQYIDFINNKAPWYNIKGRVNPEVKKLDEYKDKLGQFYEYSFERDKVFIENLDKYSKGVKALFMVTGGFHTENMKDLLRDKGYSYMLITPKLRQEKYNPYFKLLAGGLSPIESILSEYTSVLALRSPFSDMGITSEWKDIEVGVAALREILEGSLPGLLLDMPQGLIKLTLQPEAGERDIASPMGQLEGKDLFAVPLTAEEFERDARTLRVLRVETGETSHSLLSYRGHKPFDTYRGWALEGMRQMDQGTQGGYRGFSARKLDSASVLAFARDTYLDRSPQLLARIKGLLDNIPNIYMVGQAAPDRMMGRFAREQKFDLNHASHQGIFVTYSHTDHLRFLSRVLHELGAYYAKNPEFNQELADLVFDTSLAPDAQESRIQEILDRLEEITTDIHLKKGDEDVIVRTDEVVGRRDLAYDAEKDASAEEDEMVGHMMAIAASKRPETLDMCLLPYFEDGGKSKSSSIARYNRGLYQKGGLDVGFYQGSYDDTRLTPRERRKLHANFGRRVREKVRRFRNESRTRSADLTIYAFSAFTTEIAREIVEGEITEDTPDFEGTRRLRERIRIVTLKILTNHHVDINGIVTLTVGVHQQQRFENAEGVQASDIQRIRDRNLAILKYLAESPDAITEDTLRQIFLGLEPLRCKGVAEEIEQWYKQQKAVATAA